MTTLVGNLKEVSYNEKLDSRIAGALHIDLLLTFKIELSEGD